MKEIQYANLHTISQKFSQVHNFVNLPEEVIMIYN